MGGITIPCSEHTFRDLTSRFSVWVRASWWSEHGAKFHIQSMHAQLTTSWDRDWSYLVSRITSCVEGRAACIVSWSSRKLVTKFSKQLADKWWTFYSDRNEKENHPIVRMSESLL
jgi:hypothetical protein